MTKSKGTGKNRTFWRSSAVAAQGFVQVVRSEKKVRLALVVTVLVMAATFAFDVTRLEKLFLLFVWIQVIVGEIFNTSLEKAMDHASGKEFHPLVKRGKDYAAASVFVLSVLATFITLMIFTSKPAFQS